MSASNRESAVDRGGPRHQEHAQPNTIRHSLHTLGTTTLLVLSSVTGLRSQDSSATTPYFVYLRAGDASPAYAYVLCSVGKVIFGGGIVADWRNAYREFTAGAGLNLYAQSGNGTTVMAAVANATDSWYLEVWVFPTLARGGLSLTGFGGAYVPLEPAGVWQYYLDPLAVFWRVRGPIRVGGSYSGYKVVGLAARHGLGPAIQLALPHGSAILEILRDVQNFRHDVRATLQFVF